VSRAFVAGLGLPPVTTTQRDAIPAGHRPPGTVVYNTTTGQVEVNLGTDGSPNWLSMGALPTGSVIASVSSVAPSGYVLADGSQKSRTTLSALFAMAGTTFGSGDGSTTFNLPNIQGRAIVGVASGDSLFGSLGALSGEKSHVLTIAELAAHGHTLSGNGLLHSAPGSSYNAIQKNFSTNNLQDVAGSSLTVNNTGGDGAHNNVQPSIALYVYIKT
jgi:microcystin-dependent protein